jgi:glucose/arabinose dehydrogenase
MNNTITNNPLDPNPKTAIVVSPSSLDTTNQGQVKTSASSSANTTLQANDSTISQGNGLKGEYYDNQNFTNLKVTRTDPTVNFNWGVGSPDKSIGADSFSVRWTGQVEAKYNESYTFYSKSDDGVRLWVNGQQIINRFVNQSAKELSGTIALEAGKKYDIKLEYYENTGQAVSQLSWSSASQSKEIISKSQLYTDVTPPTTIINAPNLTTSGGNTYTFNVTYSDNTIVNVATLDSNDLLVTGPNGFSQLAKFVSVDDNSENSPRTATYSINPVEGNWNVSNNGTYAIALQANQVGDINGNFTEAGTVGSFKVDIAGTGTGLKAEYYDNQNFTNLKVTRTDPTVNFNWGIGSPDKSIGADTFSARWTGKVEAKYSETYTFYSTSDDGARLWINGQQIINNFVHQGAKEVSGTIALVAGQKYDIKLEYFEGNVYALSQLSWSSTSQSKEIIPQSQLYLPVIQPTITLGASVTTVRESNTNASITVLRSGDDLTKTSSINYATIAETATAGVDYIETAGTITFDPGETSKQITIPILNDSLAEQDETFGLVIDEPEGADLGIQRTLGITIQDDDRLDLVFSKPRVNEKDGTATVTATRGQSSEVASVNYTTGDGTAIAGSDYQAVSGTLNFAAGQNSKTITIPIINDTVGEANETFTLKFSNAVGVGLNIEDTAVISITDDDPGNFVKETVVSGLNQPTAFDWSSDGQKMFIAQKDGVVKVFDNGKLLTTPFIDISQQVNNVRDRGLLGIAVHPDFLNNPYVYLLFTYDPPEVYTNTTASKLDDADQLGNRAGRLIRVTADSTTNYTTAVPGSEVVLLGKNSTWEYISHPDGDSTNVKSNNTLNFAPSGILNTDGKLFTNTQDYLNNLNNITNVQDFIATDSESHSIGTVRFGSDGSLFVGVGDGTSYNQADPRVLRVQDVNNLSGKILRIDPMTGEGLSDNPFYNNDPNSNRSKVYNLGFRNPFRFTIDKRNNTPIIGDVGWRTWEEVNIGKKGANFGWPYFEGGLDAAGNPVSLKQSDYGSNPATSASATAFYNSGSPVTAAAYTYKHFGSNAIIVGELYTGTTFPSIYQNALFVGDASQGTIDALTFDSEGKVVSVRRFADSTTDPNSPIVSPVQITTGPDSNLYYVSLYTGKIERWRPV